MRNYGEEGEMDKKEKEKKNQKEQREEGKAGEGKVSVVVTVKNDEAGIARLMESLGKQTVKPDEVVVVRAGKGVYRSLKEFKGNVRVVSVGADCSRGRGRNVGIRMARNEVIAVTDAGCRPRRDWLDKLYKCYKSYKSFKESPCHSARRHLKRRRILSRADDGRAIVVGGWYRAEAKTQLQRVMAHFLVPAIKKEEKVQKDKKGEGNTLPASRSIMFTKTAWELVGGYPEEAVSGGEDLEFARRLAQHPDIKMIYCPEALVDWDGPATLREFFRDIVKHTRGNVEAGYWPHLWRNATVAGRWIVFLIFPWMIPIYLGIKIIKIINIINGLRSHLAMRSACRRDKQGDTLNLILFIPMVQLAADGGVIWGLISGILGRFGRYGEKDKKDKRAKKDRKG